MTLRNYTPIHPLIIDRRMIKDDRVKIDPSRSIFTRAAAEQADKLDVRPRAGFAPKGYQEE
jgi:hypothetical protein